MPEKKAENIMAVRRNMPVVSILSFFVNDQQSTVNSQLENSYLGKIHEIANVYNVSVEWLRGETDKKEKPTEDDGLSEKRKALIDFAKSVPEDKADMILRVMKSIVEADL